MQPGTATKRKADSDYLHKPLAVKKQRVDVKRGDVKKTRYEPPKQPEIRGAKRKAVDEYQEGMAKRQKKALDRSTQRKKTQDGSRWSSSTRWEGKGKKRRMKQQEGSNKKADTRIPLFYP